MGTDIWHITVHFNYIYEQLSPYIDLYLLINYFQQRHTGMISIHMCDMVGRLNNIFDK